MSQNNLTPPPPFNAEKSYEVYKTELKFWQAVTTQPKNKLGPLVALSLPQNEACNIREKVMENVSIDDLTKENGLEILIEFLDLHLKEDELEDCLAKFEDFEDYKRSDESVSQYISLFEQKYNKIKLKGIKLPSEVLAFKLLRRAGLTSEEKMLVLTGMNYAQKDTLYEQAQKSLKKFKGDGSTGGASSGSNNGVSGIKTEPANYFTEGRRGNYRGRGRYEKSNYGRGRADQNRDWRGGRSADRGASYRGRGSQRNQGEKKVNPLGKDGETLLCKSCGSFRHFVQDCPDSWENMKKVNFTEDEEADSQSQYEEHVVLFTGNKAELKTLGIEAYNSAVLDSACTSIVCGEKWLDNYLASLSHEDRKLVTKKHSSKQFRFGGETTLPSQGEFSLPACLVGENITINTDVVQSDIPLLFSRSSMKKLGMVIDYSKDTANIMGKDVSLNFTSSGHHCVPLMENITVEEVNAVKLHELPAKERYHSLLKLHRQFAHPPQAKLEALLKDAGAWRDSFADQLSVIHEKCQLCKEYARTPPRPVVGLPMASSFNDRVAMDLKCRSNGGGWILYMIDMWSRFTQAVIISRKLPSEVINCVLKCWVGTFGVMKGILTDNGGEFNAEEVRDMASVLNITVATTSAESPFQNGLCERNHAVVDMMLTKLQAQFPKTPANVLLQWAVMAKNSLQMWNGFSSYQLVFGNNPNLPNILTDNLPALEGKTSSEVLATHLNALHAARNEFIKTESDERIRRALRSKVRASEQQFNIGDRVYYKRENSERWLGPGKVLSQDGKLIFVRHGGTFVRVSPNRLIKAGHEFLSEKYNGDQSKLSNMNEGQQSSSSENNQQQLLEEVTQEDLRGPVVINEEHNTEHPIEVADDPGDRVDGIRRSLRVFNKETGNQVYMTCVPRSEHNSDICKKAKLCELDKLKHFDVYEVVPFNNQECISTRWIIWYKGEEVRARLVARGFEETIYTQNDSPTVGKCVIRIFLAVASSLGWTIKTTDIKSAFLQGNPIDRDVYVKPPREAVVEGSIWKLRKCLYGLNDASRKFYNSVVEELTRLGCHQSKLDPTLFLYKNQAGTLCGMIVSHIDDFLHSGNEEFDERIMEKLRSRFLAGKLEDSEFVYVGFGLKQTKNGITLDQKNYIDGLEVQNLSYERLKQKKDNLTGEEYTQLRSIIGSLNWAVHGSRPDLAFEMLDLSTKMNRATVDDLHHAIKAIKRLKHNDSFVHFPVLGHPGEWRLVGYTDASLNNISDGVGSSMSSVLFLVDRKNKCSALSWRANKIKRVVRSTLAAEALSLEEGIEEMIYIKMILTELLGMKSLPVHMFVDNQSTVDSLQSTKLVDDKRLRVDMAAIKESIQQNDIASVQWCPAQDQVADCMTKRGASSSKLLAILQRGSLSVSA